VINESGKWFMLTRDGRVVEGEANPEAASVLAAPGAIVPDDVAAQYKLADRLKPAGESAPQVDAAGKPVVVKDGRALAADLLPPEDKPDPKDNTQGTVEAAKTDEVTRGKVGTSAGAKAVTKADAAVEDKAVAGPKGRKDEGTGK
jgi:hypothetical protein